MKFTAQDTLTVAALLREAALAEIMPRFRSLTEGQIRQKSSATDLVTDADEAAERLLTIRLKETFPGCAVIGEEATAADPSLLNHIAAPIWRKSLPARACVVRRMNIASSRRATPISCCIINSCRGIMPPVGSSIARRVAIRRGLMAVLISRRSTQVACSARQMKQVGMSWLAAF